MEFSDQLEASEVEAVQRGIAQAAQELKEVGQLAWPSSKAAPTRKPKLSKKYSSMKRSIVTTTQCPLSMLNFDEINQLFVELTEIVRREDAFELEKLVPDISDEFLKSAVSSAVDGIEPELLQEILENWVKSLLQEQEVKYHKIIEDVMSIQGGDSPRIVGLKLEKLF